MTYVAETVAIHKKAIKRIADSYRETAVMLANTSEVKYNCIIISIVCQCNEISQSSQH